VSEILLLSNSASHIAAPALCATLPSRHLITASGCSPSTVPCAVSLPCPPEAGLRDSPAYPVCGAHKCTLPRLNQRHGPRDRILKGSITGRSSAGRFLPTRFPRRRVPRPCDTESAPKFQPPPAESAFAQDRKGGFSSCFALDKTTGPLLP
jgi:hypothetical protein